MPGWAWLLVGMWIGGTMGVLVAAIMAAAGRADELSELRHGRGPRQ